MSHVCSVDNLSGLYYAEKHFLDMKMRPFSQFCYFRFLRCKKQTSNPSLRHPQCAEMCGEGEFHGQLVMFQTELDGIWTWRVLNVESYLFKNDALSASLLKEQKRSLGKTQIEGGGN